RAPGRLHRDAARPPAPHLPQFLPGPRPLALHRHSPGEGLLMSYTVLDSMRHRKADKLREQFCLDVLMGFSSEPKFLPSRYFYDARGSRLFQRITELPDYYPTSCEFEILSRIGPELASF